MEDNEMKFCKDCKWCSVPKCISFDDGKDIEMYGEYIEKNTKCSHPKNVIKIIEKSYITGKDVELSYKTGNCNGLRAYNKVEDDRFCGIDARWFEAKE